MTRRNHPEQQIQRAVMEHLAWRAKPGVFALHIPNGGWRTAIEGAILKSLGVKAGAPDILVIHNGRTFGLELKPEHGGRLSDAQLNTHARMREAGAVVAVAYGLDEALGQLTEWQLLRGAAS